MWIVAMTIALVLMLVLIAPIFSKWRNSPTYTSLNTTNYPIWNIPFPGVTVCSNNVINEKQLKAKLRKEP